MHLSIAIATAGRRESVSELLSQLAVQSRLPDVVAICPASPEDVDLEACERAPFPVEVLHGPRGLTRQRNALLASLPQTDLVIFFDDDFVPAPAYLAECEAVFEREPSVVMVTGRVIADGILGPGLTLAAAHAHLDSDQAPATDDLAEVYNGYGCNMAVRAATVREAGLWFDEILPLYGWLEDVDFSRGLAEHGRIVLSERCRGVHMGVKRGRTSGIKLGYSQIANPLYLVRKRRLTLRRAAAQIGRNMAANSVKAWRPEPWVDRRGRLGGNMRGLLHLTLGRLDPAEISKLP